MIITPQALRGIYTAFNTVFNKAFEGQHPTYEKVATVVPSTSESETYAWLGDIPGMREWIGEREIQNLSGSAYTIKNKDFELTVGVDRNAVEDDKIGLYNPSIQMLGESAALHPDELVYGLLANGFTEKCYDGKAFFATDHPVGKDKASNKGTAKLSMDAYDISSSKLYSITSNTKVVVNNLQQDVTIYWVVQSGEENDVIENLLSKYESLSDHIEVAKKNPDVYPTFTQQYTSESVPNNSLIVESGERSRYISYNDIYVQTTDMYSYSYSTSFDGEGAITSAIDYVVNEEQPKLYLVEGHGEADLPSTFAEQVEKDNIETESLSLLHTETIPEDADCLMIYAPESDISEDERDLLAEYVSGGGKLLVIAGPTREDGILENLYSLLSDYGVEPAEGIVVESDSNYYSAFSGPAALLPQLQSDDITDSLIGSNYSVIMPIALGLIVDDSASGTVTELLTTSGTSFSKVTGYAMTTYDYEDGDIDGPFATGVSVRPGDGEMVWFTSSYFLEDAYNASSSGANGDLVMNALADMIGESEAMAIRSKSLNYDYLSISSSTASLLKVLMIGAFPLAYLGIGVGVVLTRRRKQNEAV